MFYARRLFFIVLVASVVLEWQTARPTDDAPTAFIGSKAGAEREVAGIKLCWCPPGKFMMGSPRSEPERRPGEDQVEATLACRLRAARSPAAVAELMLLWQK